MSNKSFDNDTLPSITSLHEEKTLKESSKNDIFKIVLNKIIQKICRPSNSKDSFSYLSLLSPLLDVKLRDISCNTVFWLWPFL